MTMIFAFGTNVLMKLAAYRFIVNSAVFSQFSDAETMVAGKNDSLSARPHAEFIEKI